jgi:membrane-bound metal-dependent hydrolase YbcI (DUF457 family)
MSQAFTILSLVLAFCLPLLLVLWWPTRDWRFGVLLVGLVLSGWLLLISDAMIANSHDAGIGPATPRTSSAPSPPGPATSTRSSGRRLGR